MGIVCRNLVPVWHGTVPGQVTSQAAGRAGHAVVAKACGHSREQLEHKVRPSSSLYVQRKQALAAVLGDRVGRVGNSRSPDADSNAIDSRDAAADRVAPVARKEVALPFKFNEIFGNHNVY